MNYKNIFKRETKVIAYVVICLTLVVISASYAMFLQVNKNTDNQVVETGDLVIRYTNKNGEEVSDSDIITKSDCLEPMDDTDASIMNDCVYFLNILNRGSLPADYRLVIYNNVEDAAGKTLVDHSFLRIGVKKGPSTSLADFKVQGLMEFTHTPETVDTENQNDIRYILDEGILEAGADITYSVQAWLDEDKDTRVTTGQSVYLKLEVTGVVKEDTPITEDNASGEVIVE